MKRAKLIRILIISTVAVILLSVGILFIVVWSMMDSAQVDGPTITFSQKCDKEDEWTYRLSNDTVLKQVLYSESILFSNKTQKWQFEIIGEGEVSIKWNFIDNDSIFGNAAYTETYIFNSDGSYTKIAE